MVAKEQALVIPVTTPSVVSCEKALALAELTPKQNVAPNKSDLLKDIV
jgi:hypothetical protein